MASEIKFVPVTFIEPLRLRDEEFRARAGYAQDTDAAWQQFRYRLTRTHGLTPVSGRYLASEVDKALNSAKELVR